MWKEIVGILLLSGPFFLMAADKEKGNYSSSVSATTWQMEGSLEQCRLKQNIANYGEWIFEKKAGNENSTQLHSWQIPAKSQSVIVEAVPPAWRHDQFAHVITKTQLQTKDPQLYLKRNETQKILDELQKGMQISIRFMNNGNAVTIEISPVNFSNNFEKYNACISKLLPYRFEDISEVYIYFSRSGMAIDKVYTSFLLNVARYIQAGGKISKITLSGYTELYGRAGYNKKIANTRAETIQGFLVQNGIKKEMIEIKETESRDLRHDPKLHKNNRCVIMRLLR